MTKLLTLCYFLLWLYGCDVAGSTWVHRASANGSDILHSKVVAQPGVARFECLRSASGQCHYTLFPRACTSPAGPKGGTGADCPSEPIGHFSIADGDSRLVPGLQRFRVCVSAEGGAPEPDCQAPVRVAAL